MSAEVPIAAGAAVYGVVMNDAASLARLGASAAGAPYKGLPRAPVLYIKPRTTWAPAGARIALPAGERQVEVAAVIGVRLAADTARVSPRHAAARVDACLLAADLSLPHQEYFRPAIRQKCFDGALPIAALPGLQADAVGGVVLRTHIDGRQVDERRLSDLLRPVPQLVADVSEFMTLRQGDVLLTGVVYRSPLAAAGAPVRVEACGLGSLEFTITETLP